MEEKIKRDLQIFIFIPIEIRYIFKGKFEINNLIFHPSVVNNLNFELFLIIQPFPLFFLSVY